ncbi:MAG TPA: 1,4-dihydroxy-2-naphthoate octaprenyltransferase [Vicinamibacterales bacterium]|nr:1,4-dihydroxy-2-naphthoate octaprenyltransferase [Vicinamibacterales bacterium]
MGVSPWILAARPKTLTASLAPVIVGTGLAIGMSDRPARLWLALVALLSAVCIQIGTNLVNDAADFEKGADTEGRLGPTRVTQMGLLPGRTVMIGAAAFFVAATVLGIPLVLAGGTPILVIGLLSLAGGYAYTTGPFPLAYRGLGEVFVLLFFGFAAVKGMAYVLVGEGLWPWAEVAALQVGLQSATLLAINNTRDIAGDRKAGKRTLAARFGLRFARIEILALVAAPFALTPLWFLAGKPGAALLPWGAMPVALRLVDGVRREQPGRRFNVFLAWSSLLQLLFSALVFAGLVLGAR